jgi:hypothetical protein
MSPMPLARLLCLLVLLQDDLDRRRDAIASRLESLRGLAFSEPLRIREGSRRDYSAFVLENARRVYGDLGAAEKGLKALALLPAKLRLDLALTAQAGLAPKAYCAAGELVLLDRQAEDEWILNKMDLGLVDQHFRPKLPSTYDAQMAYAALRMGDAEVVKHLSRKGQPLTEDLAKAITEDTLQWEHSQSKLASAVVPRLFVRTGEFAWRRGGAFAVTLYAQGGTSALNQAYARPPILTRHILHPDRYLKHDRAADIGLEAADAYMAGRGYGAVYHTVLGELGTAIVLETHFPKEDSGPIAEGWDGDTFAVYEKEGSLPVVVWATLWEGEAAALKFQGQALKISLRIAPTDPNLLAPVLRRKTSVAVAQNVPKDLEEGLFEALWKCTRKKDREATYGE